MPVHTCSSPPQSNQSNSDGASQASGGHEGNVQWSSADETALIEFLAANLDKAGDGFNFKPSVWTAAANHMQPIMKKGGPKTSDKCKAKWTRVCT